MNSHFILNAALHFLLLVYNLPCVCQDENQSEITHPELPSEDSMFVHPSHTEQETQPTSLQSQVLVNAQLQMKSEQ